MFFASCKSLDGSHCAQVYYGMTSHMLNIYGMHQESNFLTVHKDFFRNEGIPSVLHHDNSKAQQSEAVLDLHRQYMVADEFSEPHYQHQNPVESQGVHM